MKETEFPKGHFFEMWASQISGNLNEVLTQQQITNKKLDKHIHKDELETAEMKREFDELKEKSNNHIDKYHPENEHKFGILKRFKPIHYMFLGGVCLILIILGLTYFPEITKAVLKFAKIPIPG